MKKDTHIVRYAAGIDHQKSNPEFKAIRWLSKKVAKKSLKVYLQSPSVLTKLSKGERLVLDYCTYCMDASNRICNDNLFKDGLLEYTKMHFSHKYINNAIVKLVQIEILIKLKNSKRGKYIVNPLFFFKGSEKDRIKLIRWLKEKPFYSQNNLLRFRIPLTE